MARFTEKVAIVTGGGSGLGEAFAHRFAREGANVVVADVDEAGGTRVANAIKTAGGSALFTCADVTDASSMEAAVEMAVRTYGGLDIAVNNAGVGGGIHLITEFPVADWTQTIMVNLVGVFHSMRAEIPAMLERGGGSIVNISSMVGAIAHPYTSAYVASKHGVVGITKSAALEWGPKNIRVNAVGPTWVRTPLTETVWDTDEVWAQHAAEHPLGRVATTDDIASLVAFLSSDEAGIITGSLYLADGGYTAK
jgi:NAD(P)-dependent dehydrogenase (short-subunit alcohol dehydrogenase family)